MDDKEQIKYRILRHAALFWGFNEADMDVKAFDPLVNLLSGAIATELSLVNQELDQSRQRIEERVLEHLTPDISIQALPAHAILHSRPVKPNHHTRVSDQFFTTKDDEIKGPRDIFFSPAGRFPLVDGVIRYLAVDDAVFDIENIALRERIATAKEGQRIAPGTVWLGMELNSKVSGLEAFHFFLTWRNQEYRQRYLSALPVSKWSIKGKPLKITNELVPLKPLHIIEEYSTTAKIQRQVLNYYQDHFFQIKGFADSTQVEWQDLREHYPSDFEEIFSLDDISKWEDLLVWIKLEVPLWVELQPLRSLVCHINSFPVINRRQQQKQATLREHYRIVPLPCEQSFLDVNTVVNQSNDSYQRVPLTAEHLQQGGTYNLRRFAVGKFRQRDATEQLQKLTHLMRDEADAFSAFDLKLLREDLDTMKNSLARLEKHILDQYQQREIVPYLFIKPKQLNDKITVEYWETNGADANDLASARGLEPYRQPQYQRRNINLITSSTGGRDKLGTQQKKYIYKHALLSRGRIVTIEDVRTFCLADLPGMTDRINIKRGYAVSKRPKEGLIPVLQVLLVPSDNHRQAVGERLADLERRLNERSSILMPITINLVGHEH